MYRVGIASRFQPPICMITCSGTRLPGHDVVSGHGPGVPDENPWQDTPHWKVGGRDPIHVRIR